MRLWHEALIPLLPRQQLLGQHRECCALRGLGWGKPHATVNYVFEHPRTWLWAYHRKIMIEMIRRGYKPDLNWLHMGYRGRSCPFDTAISNAEYDSAIERMGEHKVYPEHNERYLNECLENLARKGIIINKEEIQ